MRQVIVTCLIFLFSKGVDKGVGSSDEKIFIIPASENFTKLVCFIFNYRSNKYKDLISSALKACEYIMKSSIQPVYILPFLLRN